MRRPSSTGWPRWAPFSDRSPRRRLFLVVLTAVLLATTGVVAHAVAREWGVPPTADPSDKGTVLLIPGHGSPRGVLEGLAARLRVVGRPSRVMTMPADGTGDLRGQAAAIDDAVRALLRHGASTVDLVGYSAGGVAAWQYLRTGRTAPAVRRLVTLGSPLRGTAIAAAATALTPESCREACHQLVPGSALLTELAAGPRPSIPWLSVWTDADEVVDPPDSAVLPGITAIRVQSICPSASTQHSSLPGSRLVIGLVLRGLGTRPLPRPTTADCETLQAEGVGWPVLVGTE
ncbi:lipase [Actinomycetospora sp. NBRC 106375]|uniref:esterase/lipase family protein n=1 Tax=Actinomycetospora sp. NBRC 106375 TaxID=3032207 RepID=UPI0024A4AB00|nr:alpha/beta hydrolase [Actinomycetospora sp. NBRC 106375]GLZ49823.1 lipase [Actinomycetospora sp. NBRC 106375]